MNKTIRWTSGKNKGSLKGKYQHCQNYYINLHERTCTTKIVKSCDTGKKVVEKKNKKNLPIMSPAIASLGFGEGYTGIPLKQKKL